MQPQTSDGAPDSEQHSHEDDRPTLRFGLESGPGYRSGLRDMPRNLNVFTVVTGLFPVFIICLSVAAIIVTTSEDVGLSTAEVIFWMSSIYVFGGLLSILFAPYYKQPIVGAFSIPGVIVVMGALDHISYAEMLGGTILAGLLVFLLGITGVMRVVVRLIPMPILGGMIAGILMSFPLGIIDSFGDGPWIAAAAVVGYIVFHQWVPFAPGILGGILGGTGAALALGQIGAPPVNLAVSIPTPQMPAFSLAAVLSVAIPMAILTVGAENMQAIAVLRSIGRRPPVTSMTVVSGISTLLAGVFGGHSANIAGPTTAMAASPDAGKPQGKYVAATIAGLTFILFGLFTPLMIGLIGAIPPALTAVLIGLVLVPTVAASLASAWQGGRFQLGTLTAFLVALSDITVLGISAAFWSVLLGCAVSVLIERGDYAHALRAKED